MRFEVVGIKRFDCFCDPLMKALVAPRRDLRVHNFPNSFVAEVEAFSDTGKNPPSDELLNAFRRRRHRLWRAWELKEGLRDLYRHVPTDEARLYLQGWITSAVRSRIPAFVNLARQIKRNFEGIVAAVELQLSNSRLEGINARIRLIQRRGHGYHSVDALAAVIHLCLGGIVVQLPTQR